MTFKFISTALSQFCVVSEMGNVEKIVNKIVRENPAYFNICSIMSVEPK